MKQDQGSTIGGVYCGREIAPTVYAEEVAQARYVIRKADSPSNTRRVGEVFGERGRFLACRMNGAQVGTERSLQKAAGLLY